MYGCLKTLKHSIKILVDGTSAVTDMERMFGTAKVFDQKLVMGCLQVQQRRYMSRMPANFPGVLLDGPTKANNRYRIFYRATAGAVCL